MNVRPSRDWPILFFLAVAAAGLMALFFVVRGGLDVIEDANGASEGRLTAYRIAADYNQLSDAARSLASDPEPETSTLLAAARKLRYDLDFLERRVYPTLDGAEPLNRAVADLEAVGMRLDVLLREAVEPDFERLYEELRKYEPSIDAIASAVHRDNERHYAALERELRRRGIYLLLITGLLVLFAAMCALLLWMRNARLERQKTALEANEAKLREMSFYRQQFLANMSHEFRTPLNAILGFSDAILFQGDTIARDKILEYVKIVSTSASDLARLTEDVLDLSKIDAGKISISPEDVDFTRLVEDSVVQFEAIAKQRGVRIRHAIESRWLVHCDRLAIKRCITNVLSNAVKFSEKGSRITLEAYIRDPKMLVVDITDEGCGIPERDLHSIWMIYSRSSLTRKTDREGAGLGLAIVKGLMDAHNGFVELQSREGVGTSVRLCFPTSMVVATDPGSPKTSYRRRATDKPGLASRRR